MSKLTEEEIKKLVEDAVEDYFAMKRPGFNFEANYTTQGHGIAEFSLTTDTLQGFQFYKKGDVKVLANKSIEVVAGGRQESEDAFSIMLDAKTGHIEIKALNGDLILKGANVKILATDADGDVWINSQKTITVEGPEVEVKGTKTRLTGKQNMNIQGGTTEIYAETGAVLTGSGQDTVTSPTLVGKLLNFLTKAKQILDATTIN